VAFDSSPVTLSISTLADGRFVAVNHAGQRVFGYTEEEAVGRTAAELGIWFDFGERDNLVEGIEEGESRTAEVVLRTKGGEPRMYVLSVARFDIDGEAYLLSSANDVTEQKRAEEALRASERRFAVAFDSSPVTLAITTVEDGNFVAVNSTALRLFGMTSDEVIGHTALELGIWVDYAERAKLFDGLEEGETRAGEVEFRMKNGSRTYSLPGST
jgi:PAS domain S-box-containing protein